MKNSKYLLLLLLQDKNLTLKLLFFELQKFKKKLKN